MKSQILTSKHLVSVLLGGALMTASLLWASAQEARFFRVAGSVPTTITGLSADGTITWTNTPTNATFTVQTTTAVQVPSNWQDYVQVPASNAVTTERILNPNPPSGMVLIPAGSFTMGDTMGDAAANGWAWELPAHTVYVSAFYMDQDLVTSNLWLTVKAWNSANGYGYDNPGSGKASNHPVQTVNWYDVVKWCNARSQMEGLTSCYYTDSGLTVVYKAGDTNNVYVNWGANGYRLPTEAEWEKAARGGLSGHRFPWGDTISESQANYYSYGTSYYSYDLSNTGYNPAFNDGVRPYTSPVGYFAPNGYGLYDTAGNVWEWCWDWYDPAYYSSSPGTDPQGPSSSLYGYRVLRGGSWGLYAADSRCAYRGYIDPRDAFYNFGFRCVRGL
jgi:formylglycine-generating enzyme required for sulfatase activity